jgi:hypothetical protein
MGPMSGSLGTADLLQKGVTFGLDVLRWDYGLANVKRVACV